MGARRPAVKRASFARGPLEFHPAVFGPDGCPTTPAPGGRHPRMTPALLYWLSTPPCWAAAPTESQKATERRHTHGRRWPGLLTTSGGVPCRPVESYAPHRCCHVRPWTIAFGLLCCAHPGSEAVDDGHDRPLAPGPPLCRAFERRQESGCHRHRTKEVLRVAHAQSCSCATLQPKARCDGMRELFSIKRERTDC